MKIVDQAHPVAGADIVAAMRWYRRQPDALVAGLFIYDVLIESYRRIAAEARAVQERTSR